MERGLFVSIAFWPEANDPAGRLGRAADLVALHEPTAALEVVPRHVLQQIVPEPAPMRMRRRARAGLATLAIHIGFAAAFVALLTWRPTPPTHEIEMPVEVVVEPPPPKPQAPPKPEPPKPEPPKSLAELIPQAPPAAAAAAPAPNPNPPAPPVVQPLPADAPAPPPLVAPPPEPTRAKTQTQDNKPPNLESDDADAPKATHEPKPLEAPKVLSTADPKAGFAVPRPAEVPTSQPPAPAPEAPKAPTETEKLAAALPMDTTAMPDSFRAVLSGNGAAVDAAYKGLVYGRFSHAAEIGERARQQHLKGQVIVAFSIGDDGRIKNLAVLQSSGNPAVDALGMEMIRTAGPFPPPPPGAQRSFTPALAFGE